MYGSRRHRGGYYRERQANPEPAYTVEDPDGNPIPVDSDNNHNEGDTGHRPGDQRGHEDGARREREGRPITPSQDRPRRRTTRRDSRGGGYRRGSFGDAHRSYERNYYRNDSHYFHASDSEEAGYSSYGSGYETSDSDGYGPIRHSMREDRSQFSRLRPCYPRYDSPPSYWRRMRDDRPYGGFDNRYTEDASRERRGRAFEESENCRHGTGAYEHRRACACDCASRDDESRPRQRPREDFEGGGGLHDRDLGHSDSEGYGEINSRYRRRYVYRGYR